MKIYKSGNCLVYENGNEKINVPLGGFQIREEDYSIVFLNIATRNSSKFLFSDVLRENGTAYGANVADTILALRSECFSLGGGVIPATPNLQDVSNQGRNSTQRLQFNGVDYPIASDLALKADLVAGLVPASQLPSYVDDVLEFANLASLPAIGESSKIYITINNNKNYRWTGSIYVEVSPSDVNSVFGRTGIISAQNGDYNTSQVPENTNLYFTVARVLSTVLTGFSAIVGNVSATDTILQAFGKIQNRINNSGLQAATDVQNVTTNPILVNRPGVGNSQLLGGILVTTQAGSNFASFIESFKISVQSLLNNFKTNLIFPDPTQENNITLKNGSGILAFTSDITAITNLKADLVAGLVPASQLPSYVDDVLEFANLASLPAIGESSKIYITINNNKNYRWTGSVYVEVSPSDVNSVNGKTGIVVLNTADIADSLNKRYQTDNQNTFNDANSSIQTQLNGKLAISVADLAYTRNLFTQITTVTTTNVTTETDLLATYSIPANLLTAGGTIRIQIGGLYSRGAGNSTFRVYLGSTLISFTLAANAANATNSAMRGYADIVFRTVGASGTVMCTGGINLDSVVYGLINAQTSGTPSITATTINTTVTQQVRITHQFSATNAANTLSTLQANVILIKN